MWVQTLRTADVKDANLEEHLADLAGGIAALQVYEGVADELSAAARAHAALHERVVAQQALRTITAESRALPGPCGVSLPDPARSPAFSSCTSSHAAGLEWCCRRFPCYTWHLPADAAAWCVQ